MSANTKQFTERELGRIIEMAWENRTPFESILFQFGLIEKEVMNGMLSNLKESIFKHGLKCLNSGVGQKHLKKSNSNITRFKCSLKTKSQEIK